MNERIKELSKQAGISILYEYDGYDGHAAVANLSDIEKFAELIVVKCANIVWDEAEKTMNKEINEVGYEILKQFGIEK